MKVVRAELADGYVDTMKPQFDMLSMSEIFQRFENPQEGSKVLLSFSVSSPPRPLGWNLETNNVMFFFSLGDLSLCSRYWYLLDYCWRGKGSPQFNVFISLFYEWLFS